MRFLLLVCLGFIIPHNALAIAFSPTAADVNVWPGDSVETEFIVQNTQGTAQDYAASLYSVQFDPTTDDPSFGPLAQDIAAWVTLDSYNFTVAAEDEQLIVMTVAPPPELAADSLVVGLVMRELPSSNAVSVVSGASSLVFITVGAPATKASITSFSADLFTATLPADITTKILNEGERVVQPHGSVMIYNTWGKAVTSYDINPALRRVPAGQSRAYTVTWGEQEATGSFWHELWREVADFRIGVFTAELVAAPYPGGEATLHDRDRLVMLPWRLLLIGGVVSALAFVRYRRR